MSLAATHILFALDLKEEYQVDDMEKFIAGTVYPDSRYVTKIDRELTHNEELLKPEFVKDDFKKGWQAHQVCDVMHGRMKKRASPESFVEKYSGYDENRWLTSTAMKVIQDMNDMKKFPLDEYLSYLDCVHCPNGEKEEDVRNYNQAMIKIYKNKREMTLSDYYEMWIALGVGKELAEKVVDKTRGLMADKALVKRIENIYEDMLENYREAFIF